MTTPAPVQRAIISVSDKLGLADFARGLADAGVEIYSTGGTRRHLESDGIAVRDVADYTGFPEMMDGRLKTLHPKVFGGILCRHDREDDMEALAEHGIVTFELVVVNLYPFEATVARAGVTMAEAIEQIDIGGSDAGPGGGQEPRLHDDRHQPGAVPGDPRGDRPTRAHDLGACGDDWPARPSPTRPPTTGRSPITSPARRPRGRFPAR